MLDMGFIDDVEQIISVCPKDRQTLFFSATISPEISRLAGKHMREHIKVTATRMVDPKKLKQVYYDVQPNMKLSLLVHLLQQEKAKSALSMVFCNTRRTTDFVVNNLKANGINAIAIHGGLTQNKRSKTMDMFNNAQANVLVCTDVAARGLHIDNVGFVFNYEIPADPKDYVHRIGRTARAGEEGEVVNILSDNDYDNFSRILAEYRDFSIAKEEKPYCKKIFPVKGDFRGRQGGGRFGRSSGSSFGRREGMRGSRGRAREGGRNRQDHGRRSQRPFGESREADDFSAIHANVQDDWGLD